MFLKRDMLHFEVRNSDVSIKFSCPNYGKRIAECIDNLQIQEESTSKATAIFSAITDDVEFRFGESDEWQSGDIKHQAYLFENTDYPVRIMPLLPSSDIVLKRLIIGKNSSEQVAAEDELIFGTINFRNQVGHTDITVIYEKGGKVRSLAFSTEVLSYKMDYRSDMRQVIRDIEKEFSMLSYSLLKETYLTFSQSNNESSDLIWWQIFRGCFINIVEAAEYIINRPKRRLKSEVRYERAERLPYIPPELENEYAEFKNRPEYLYRIEEMYLSKDTVENRFLKYALLNIANRFKIVKRNVLAVLNAENVTMKQQIEKMTAELDRLTLHPFFRNIGTFKGFSQDSLVMKQAIGYKDVYENWVLLQCGYELQDGIMQLEVKDISELYEIWCFIKVKNIVQHILKDRAKVLKSGHETEGDFIKKLIKGKSSEVRFVENETEIELASVMYNATTDTAADDNFDPTQRADFTDDTTSKTTEQRPDIVLRLTKDDNIILYTYLFDAKYRLQDKHIRGVDVPPVDAINQMHRYRDAIYYSQSSDQQLKREIIGGYVLYPGNLNKEQFLKSYYYDSISSVNIGAFPLKPGGNWHEMSDELLLDPASSEDVLYEQIKNWLTEERSQIELLRRSIPQKGLNYSIEPVKEPLYFIAIIDKSVNSNKDDILAGKATSFLTGYKGPQASLDLQAIKYFVPKSDHEFAGYYEINSIKIVDLGNVADKPLRVKFELGKYHKLKQAKPFGRDREAARGLTLTRDEFYKFIEDDEVESN